MGLLVGWKQLEGALGRRCPIRQPEDQLLPCYLVTALLPCYLWATQFELIFFYLFSVRFLSLKWISLWYGGLSQKNFVWQITLLQTIYSSQSHRTMSRLINIIELVLLPVWKTSYLSDLVFLSIVLNCFYKQSNWIWLRDQTPEDNPLFAECFTR